MTSIIKALPVIGEPVIDPAAIVERDDLIAYCASLPAPTDQATAQAVAVAGGLLQARIKEVEADEMSLRRPANAVLDQLRAIRNSYLAPLHAQKDAMAFAMAAYRAAEKARVESELRERQRQIDEAAEKLRREQDEAIADARLMKTEADLQAAIESEQRAAEAMQKFRDAAAVKPVLGKVAGAPSSTVVCFEVTDIVALYRATANDQGMSWAVKLEENRASIKASIQATTQLPGLRVWTEEKATFRSR